MVNKRFIAIVLAIILCVAAVSIVFTCSISYALENQEDKLTVEERQGLLDEVNMREAAVNKPESLNNSQPKTEERSLLISNFDDDKAYLYMEFDLGGYAIYDRLGDFIYERTDIGGGPYNDFDESDKLYYGGPQNYFVKIKNSYINTVTDAIIGTAQAVSCDKALEEVSDEIAEEKNDTLATSRAEIGDIINIPLGFNKGYEFPGYWYFPLIGLLDKSGGMYPTIDLSHLDEIENSDVVSPYNQYGSCVIVALVMIMQYYDRLSITNPELGLDKMVPRDASAFRLKYNFPMRCYGENGIAPISNKNLYKSEYLHQELLTIMFPNVIDLHSTAFASTFPFIVPHVETYFKRHGLKNAKLNLRNGDQWVLDNIREGNPVMAGFVEGEDFKHCVVIHGSYAKVGLFGILTPTEYLVNYGWMNKDYANVKLNKSMVLQNMSFNIF